MASLSIGDLRGIAEWAVAGEVGSSSRAIACVMLGIKPELGYYNYPYDPSDLRRCLLLLHKVPSIQTRMRAMKKCGPEWAALVDNWKELTRLFTEEVPGWPSGSRAPMGAPKTYQLMKNILEQAKQKEH